MSTSFGWALKSLYNHEVTSNVQGCQRRLLIQKLHTSFDLPVVCQLLIGFAVTVTMTPLYRPKLSWPKRQSVITGMKHYPLCVNGYPTI